jgi:predicted cobalt transporter CbtA
MFLSLSAVGWFAAAFLFVRHRQQGGHGLGFKALSEFACAVALALMGLPPLLWPNLPFNEPVPPAAVITQRVCWWAIGLIGAALAYAVFSHRPRSSESRLS